MSTDTFDRTNPASWTIAESLAAHAVMVVAADNTPVKELRKMMGEAAYAEHIKPTTKQQAFDRVGDRIRRLMSDAESGAGIPDMVYLDLLLEVLSVARMEGP